MSRSLPSPAPSSLPSPAPSSLPSMSAAATNVPFYSPRVGSRPGIHWCSFPCKSLARVRDSSGQGGMGNLAVQPGLPLSLGPQLERRTALPPKGLRSGPAPCPAAPLLPTTPSPAEAPGTSGGIRQGRMNANMRSDPRLLPEPFPEEGGASHQDVAGSFCMGYAVGGRVCLSLRCTTEA